MERALVEKTCDTCKKTHVFAPETLTAEIVAEIEKWILVGKVKFDGHGSFLPDVSHHCSENCLSAHLAKQNGQTQSKDMDKLRDLAKGVN
jgi:hypothetical protein